MYEVVAIKRPKDKIGDSGLIIRVSAMTYSFQLSDERKVKLFRI